MAAVTAAVSVGIAAAATAYQVTETKKARKEAQDEQNRQRAEADKQAQELETEQKNEEAREDAVKDRGRRIRRQQSVRGDRNQKGGTVLTSPLGGGGGNVLGQTSQEGVKSLLGN